MILLIFVSQSFNHKVELQKDDTSGVCDMHMKYTYRITYLLTYLLHAAESFLRS
jgi:hypothetical protein